MWAKKVSTNLHVLFFYQLLLGLQLYKQLFLTTLTTITHISITLFTRACHHSDLNWRWRPLLLTSWWSAKEMGLIWSVRDRSNILVELIHKHPYCPQLLTERDSIHSMEKGIHLYWLDFSLPPCTLCNIRVHLFHISDSQPCCSLSALPLNYSGCQHGQPA